MDKTYKNDSDIVNLVLKIMGNGTMEVETFNEAILVKLFELRGTPLRYRKSYRNIDKDYKQYLKENNN